MKDLPMPEVKELFQWEKQLYDAVSSPEVFARMWNEVPEHTRDCVVYECPDHETK